MHSYNMHWKSMCGGTSPHRFHTKDTCDNCLVSSLLTCTVCLGMRLSDSLNSSSTQAAVYFKLHWTDISTVVWHNLHTKSLFVDVYVSQLQSHIYLTRHYPICFLLNNCGEVEVQIKLTFDVLLTAYTHMVREVLWIRVCLLSFTHAIYIRAH